ncbi:hypothetical protein EJ377_01615 [Chryseobacterium arthrosphaerae]|uniref:PKD domain-containing protein n=1 Tax=Chryseobacterium arthrosphaerae TaxID=651561 RepID=A0A432DYT1_9FLAO|nr:hypothetical protein EJ377_01615 [Chryseobacterium arthrosphaerae]
MQDPIKLWQQGITNFPQREQSGSIIYRFMDFSFKPAGASDPVIVNPSLYNTNVTGLTSSGTYTFRWTITTGTCSSFSDLTVNVSAPAPGGVTSSLV